MLKHMDGFEPFAGGGDIPAVLVSAGYKATGSVTVGDGRKVPGKALAIDGSVGRIFTSSEQKVVIAFAYKANVKRSRIINIKDVLALDWPDHIAIGSAVGAAIPLINLWYYYEIVINKTDMSVQVWINNELDLTTQLPQAAQFQQTYECSWGPVAQGDGTKMLDDLVFIDSSAGKYVDRVGPVAMTMRLPTEDVIQEFSPSTGSAHYPLVSAVPPDDAKFIQSNQSGNMDTFRSSVVAPATGILAVGLTVRAKKSDIDGRQMGMLVGDGKGVFKEVVQTTMETSNTYSYAVFEKAPNDSDWTSNTVQTTPFGVAVRP